MAPLTDDSAVPPAIAELLTVRGLRAGYAGREVVFGVDLDVGVGEIVTLLGHNGAGKTTTLRAIFGVQHPTGGKITCAGRDMTGRAPRESIATGMSFTSAERAVFADLTVSENLEVGALHVPNDEFDARLERVTSLFPILEERPTQLAGTLSGGQQRMLSLGMALMTRPRLMLLDEPSLGLSPALAEQLMDMMRQLVDEEGLSVLLVEQNIAQALRHANRAYVMRSGEVIMSTSAEELRERGSWWDLF